MRKQITILTALVSMLFASMAAVADDGGPAVHGRISFGITSTGGDAERKNSTNDIFGTRLEASGSNDLGNGLIASYLLEYGLGNDTVDRRHTNITLDGAFGQIRAGKQTGVLYRYIGANSDQSWWDGGDEYYAIAKQGHTNHGLRVDNIAAYRFGAGPGGDDPITFDIQVQSVDNSADAEFVHDPDKVGDHKINPAVVDDEDIDSVTVGVATALGPVKLQVAAVNENGETQNDLTAFGFRVPVGSAEVRGHVTEADNDDEAWGLLAMGSFGGGYSGVVGIGKYTKGATEGELDSLYLTLTKSLGSGLSAVAEYITQTDDTKGKDTEADVLYLALIQSF